MTDNNMLRGDRGLAFVQVYRVDFDATLLESARVCTELSALALARAGTDWAAEIDLGLTEALTNVVLHAYGKDRAGRITMDCIEAGDEWLLTLDDQGKSIPEDRLHAADGSVFDFDPLDLQSIPEGGMGLTLIRHYFDQMDYTAADHGNRMRLAKHLPAPAARAIRESSP